MSGVHRDMQVRNWVNGSPCTSAKGVKAVVFIHGILSDHTRFDKCQSDLAAELSGWEFYYVDYDYHEALLANGRHLACALQRAFCDKNIVVIVAHSMGGLVARIACMEKRLVFVRQLFLLATPNHGALRTSSLGVYAQMVRATTGVLWGIRPWKRGMLDLTRVDEVMKQFVKSAGNCEDIDYVTIPGRYFHAQRGVVDHHWDERWKALFVVLDAVFGAAAVLPGFGAILSVRLERAHDGIVEEASNSLVPDQAERQSEKRRSIRRVDRAGGSVSYAHVAPDSAIDLCHVQVPDDKRVIEIVAEIIGAGRLQEWLNGERTKHDDVDVRLFNSGQ